VDERVDLKRGKGVVEERWIYIEEDASTEFTYGITASSRHY